MTAIAVKATIPGSVLFRQVRVGFRGREFVILKFRTMNGEDHGENGIEQTGDRADVVPVGRFLRRCKLDELPQLINILVGEMSFVGPRPYIKEESKGMPLERYSMRPGLTGLAQVNGNRELPWDERTAYDMQYIREFNLLLDVKILLKTVKVLVMGERACLRHL